MVNVNAVYEEVLWLANKHQTGAAIPPRKFNIAAPAALEDFFRKYKGKPEDYQKGAPFAAIAYEVTDIVNDYLADFIVTDKSILVSTSGRAIKPSDYLHRSSVSYRYFKSPSKNSCMSMCSCGCGRLEQQCDRGTQPISFKMLQNVNPTAFEDVNLDILTDAEFKWRLRNSIKYPTKQYPVCKFTATYIQVAPVNLGVIQLTYLKNPTGTPPFWNYTIVNTVPTYNPVGSVDFPVPTICKNELSVTILNRMGIMVREDLLYNYSQQLKAAGG